MSCAKPTVTSVLFLVIFVSSNSLGWFCLISTSTVHEVLSWTTRITRLQISVLVFQAEYFKGCNPCCCLSPKSHQLELPKHLCPIFRHSLLHNTAFWSLVWILIIFNRTSDLELTALFCRMVCLNHNWLKLLTDRIFPLVMMSKLF